jgi:hypothetical protein
MDLKRMMIIIAQFCLVLLVFYLAGLALTLPKVVENLSNKLESIPPSKLYTAYADINENLKNTMSIDKNRSSYQDALQEIIENVNLNILQTLSSSKGTMPGDKQIEKVHKWHNYKNSLYDLNDFLDSVKA